MIKFPAFNQFACVGDSVTVEHAGFTLRASIHLDDSDEGAPDKRSDGFWPSLDPRDAGWIGKRSPSTLRRHMVRARAVMAAYEDGSLFYCGVVVTVERDGVELGSNSLWGVECNYPGSANTYLAECANESADEALDAAWGHLDALLAAATSFKRAA